MLVDPLNTFQRVYMCCIWIIHVYFICMFWKIYVYLKKVYIYIYFYVISRMNLFQPRPRINALKSEIVITKKHSTIEANLRLSTFNNNIHRTRLDFENMSKNNFWCVFTGFGDHGLQHGGSSCGTLVLIRGLSGKKRGGLLGNSKRKHVKKIGNSDLPRVKNQRCKVGSRECQSRGILWLVFVNIWKTRTMTPVYQTKWYQALAATGDAVVPTIRVE